MKLREDIEERLEEILLSAYKKYSIDVGKFSVHTPYPYEDLIEKFGHIFHGYPIKPDLRNSLVKRNDIVIIEDRVGLQLGNPYFLDFYNK